MVVTTLTGTRSNSQSGSNFLVPSPDNIYVIIQILPFAPAFRSILWHLYTGRSQVTFFFENGHVPPQTLSRGFANGAFDSFRFQLPTSGGAFQAMKIANTGNDGCKFSLPVIDCSVSLRDCLWFQGRWLR